MSIPSITNTQTAGVQDAIGKILEDSSTIANKLSSGQGILFPYEDPAGLAIGTKLEVNLGLQKESLKSAHQASVVLNIAYGGAKGVVNILKRLDQLSIMALTGSATDSDRKLINLETQQLKAEVERIATATNFNGRNLIDGSTKQVSTPIDEDNKLNYSLYNNAVMDGTNTAMFVTYDPSGKAGERYKLNVDAAGTGINDLSGNKAYSVAAGKVSTLDSTPVDLFTVDDATKVTKITYKATDPTDPTKTVDKDITLADDGSVTLDGNKIFIFDSKQQKQSPMVFQVGAEANQQISIDFDSVSPKALGIDKLKLETVEDGRKGQELIRVALDTMFNYNSKIGAYQSRFRMVADSISTAIENVDAARAQFMDADFTELTKDFSQEQAKLTAAIAAEAKLIQTPHTLLQLVTAI
ncbi:flagellin [Rickettsiales endosymbiont of Trichoplax sp. H2]|uniref:flagellin N-terminal helical domain-containing protein n=1 Tax=Rickettsiales endosymbiont of Trichoplax sp. H2 TaxID=2021221 RepID=UPI0012B2DD57|nr:flagellin [Rickettsiales endosymbiont of Trichoplax sp. H2]MSO13912.1 Polar flagellin B/D [Rickettsiales endosymbiont of Trichoplax sp. H2]